MQNMALLRHNWVIVAGENRTTVYVDKAVRRIKGEASSITQYQWWNSSFLVRRGPYSICAEICLILTVIHSQPFCIYSISMSSHCLSMDTPTTHTKTHKLVIHVTTSKQFACCPYYLLYAKFYILITAQGEHLA